MHSLLCLIGKTASGKSTLADMLEAKEGYTSIVSYATRPPRSENEKGHIFVNDDVYNSMKATNSVAVETQIGPYKYWTTLDQLYENDIYVVDPIGYAQLVALDAPDLHVFSVYVNTPDAIRSARALDLRQDNASAFRKRDIDEREEFRDFLKYSLFEYAIYNGDASPNKAYSVLKWICNVEGIWQNHIGVDS